MSTNAVRALRGGPGRLGVTEQIQERSLTQLGEGSVRAAVADRRIAGVAPLAVRPGAELEQETELILAVNRHAAGRGYLPGLAVNDDSPLRHAHASAAAANETSVQRSQASGAYVTRLCNRFSSLISSGMRDACARCDISVGLSENSMNSCGYLALRKSQIIWPRSSPNRRSSRRIP